MLAFCSLHRPSSSSRARQGKKNTNPVWWALASLAGPLPRAASGPPPQGRATRSSGWSFSRCRGCSAKFSGGKNGYWWADPESATLRPFFLAEREIARSLDCRRAHARASNVEASGGRPRRRRGIRRIACSTSSTWSSRARLSDAVLSRGCAPASPASCPSQITPSSAQSGVGSANGRLPEMTWESGSSSTMKR